MDTTFPLMNPLSLLPPDHLYFESYLEVAAVRKSVVEYLAVEETIPQKMFVDKVIYKDNGVWIRTSKGALINKRDLEGIYVAEDPGDLEAISCLCQ